MTIRAVIIGLVVSVVLACLGYINDAWFFFSYIGGDLVPIHAYGLLIIGLLTINPLLSLLGRTWRFKPSELAVMLGMALMGSTLAGSAFFWQYPHPLITPIREHATRPGWQEKDLLQYVPDVMMVDADPRSKIVSDYMTGLGRKGEYLDPSRVPWEAWQDTMIFWVSLLSLSFVAGICMVLIVHRQWSKREHLSYPIAIFTEELLRPDPKRTYNPIFRDRVFWGGFAVSFFILLLNGAHTWNDAWLSVPTSLNLTEVSKLEFFQKTLMKVPSVKGDYGIFNPHIFFGAVGLAYFLSSEASFSLGISGLLFAVAALPFVERGVNLSGGMLQGGPQSYMWFGSYLGMALVVGYLGRRFYLAVFRKAFFIPGGGRAETLPREVWAARLLILLGVALTILLIWVGLHWLLAILFVMISGMMFLMIARVHVATGLFMIQPSWWPVSILLALFGSYAIGPEAAAILALLSTAVAFDTRIAAVPLVANVLKVGDDSKAKPAPMAGWMSVAIVISLVVALCFTVWLMYDRGVQGTWSKGTKWATQVANMPFKNVIEPVHNELAGMGELEEAREPTSVARLFGQAQPERYFFTAAGIGVALVLGCSYLRLRFPRWPLHPLVFLVWGTPWTVAYAPSFLLGWFIKGVIMKYGGQSFYHRARPFFVGLVAGEFLAAIFWAVYAVGYYFTTGTTGESFLVRP
jgi:hypothetical protein